MFGPPKINSAVPPWQDPDTKDEWYRGLAAEKREKLRCQIAIAAVQAGSQGSPREIEAFATQLAELLVPPT